MHRVHVWKVVLYLQSVEWLRNKHNAQAKLE